MSDSLPGTDARQFGSLSAAAQAELETSIRAIAKATQKNRKSLIARSSEEEYRWALHNLEAARQLAKCLPLTPPPSASTPAWAPVFTCRDYAMAENVQWALKNEGREGRLLVFAHNGHVMSWRVDERRWATLPVRERPYMMGAHLRRAYGKGLYIIATTFATASAGLPTPKPMEDRIDRTLVGVGLPLMFLDLRMARQNKEALAWLSMRRALDANISTDAFVTPSTAFDGLFFVNRLTPAIEASDRAP